MKPARILIVEDAADIREELVDYLRFHGLIAEGAEDVASMTVQLEQQPWEILVLDLGLPDGDGLAVAQALRQRRGLELGIIMITARGQADDRIAGLNAGADSYMVKPVNPRELKAVIDQLVLRLRGGTDQAPETGWALHQDDSLQLRCPNGAHVTLTGTESRLLATLFTRQGDIMERDQLYRCLHPNSSLQDTRSLDSLISRLRGKVERQAGMTLPLQTFRNLGYAFTGPLAPTKD